MVRFVEVLLASIALPSVLAQDNSLHTTNQWRIESFWHAVEASNGPVTVLAFGDSVSDDYLSIQKQLFWRLQEHFGSSGVAFSSVFQELGGGSAWVQPNSNWWASHASLPPAGYLISRSGTCDHVGLFWVAQPQGGNFTLSVLTNGVAGTAVNLNGYAVSPAGCYTNIQLPRANYNLRLDGLSGTNFIIGVQLVDYSANGIGIGFMSQDGQTLEAILDIPTNIFYPILSSLNPQLVVWHMKETLAPDSESALSNALPTLESRWQATVTNGDIVYLGTPYDSSGSAETQNPLVRQAAVRDYRAYIDCMTPCISYQQMSANGLLRDLTHPSELGNSFLANTVVWPQLGLERLETGQPLITNFVPVANPVWLRSAGSSLPVYGWASSTPDEATLVLFNPRPQTGYALFDCESAFALTPGAPQFYDVRVAYANSRLPIGLLYAAQPTLIGLNPAESVALEAHPASDQNQVPPSYAPVVLAQPVGQERYAGVEAFFSAQIWGTPPVFCQWHRDGNDLFGATSTNLVLTNLVGDDEGNYSFVATNSAGSVTSGPAFLGVLTPPAYGAAIIADHPVAYWRLDEARGPTVFDSFGTNHGIAGGHVSFGQFGALPYARQNCVGFDGTAGTKVDVAYASKLNPPLFSVECWVQSAGTTNALECPIASRDVSPAAGYFFEISADRHWTLQLGTAFGWQTNYGPAVVPGKWTFLAGVFDGSNQLFYVDGQLVAQTNAQLMSNTNRPLRFGAGATESTGGEYFSGKLDEVALFDYALSPAQVLQHYQNAFQAPVATRLSIEMVGPNVMLLWPTGQLEHADSLTGPWFPVPGATSPWLIAPTEPNHFYRLAQ